MNYEFILRWEDLPEDLRAQRIDDIINQRFLNDLYRDTEYAGLTPNQLYDNQNLRQEVESWITSHFPIYF